MSGIGFLQVFIIETSQPMFPSCLVLNLQFDAEVLVQICFDVAYLITHILHVLSVIS